MQIDLAISDYLLYLQTCGKANKTIVSYASDLNIYAKFLIFIEKYQEYMYNNV